MTSSNDDDLDQLLEEFKQNLQSLSAFTEDADELNSANLEASSPEKLQADLEEITRLAGQMRANVEAEIAKSFPGLRLNSEQPSSDLESDSHQSKDNPMVAMFQSNPGLQAMLMPELAKIVEQFSLILEARGESGNSQIWKDMAAEISSGEILANLLSTTQQPNGAASSAGAATPELAAFFSDPEVMEFLRTVLVDVLAIASANHRDGDSPQDPVVQQHLLETVWMRVLPSLTKLANNSEWHQNEAVSQFFQQYSTTPVSSYGHQYNDFWHQVIDAVYRCEGRLEETVYPLLLRNLDKLDDFSGRYLDNFVKSTFPDLDPEDAWQLAILSGEFSRLFLEFPHGNKANQVEIAIAFNQAALEIMPEQTFPQAHAFTQFVLGPCYHHRVKGDRTKNLEEAIHCYQQASRAFTPAANAYLWAVNWMHLGNAYQERIWGEKSENLELAIQAYQQALIAPQLRVDYPPIWAMTQMNLGNAYRDCTKNIATAADKQKNLQEAMTCYEKAQSIFNPEAFPQQWSMLQTNISIASLQTGRREDAITTFQHLLQRRFTREAFPEQWAMTQINLGIAYKAAKNWEQAANCFQNALQVFKRTTDPSNHAKSLTLLGFTYLESQDFYNAYLNLSLAINGMEDLHSAVVSGEKAKRDFSQKFSILYQGAIQACLELAKTDSHYYARAMEYVERSKSRSLVELLASRHLLPKGKIPEATLQRLHQLQQDIATEQQRLSNLARQDTANKFGSGFEVAPENSPGDYIRLNALQQELKSLIDREIYLIDPSFKLTQTIHPISFTEIKNLLPHDQAALIEWYIPLPLQRMQALLHGENLASDQPDLMDEATIFTFITTADRDDPIVCQAPLENYIALWQLLGDCWQDYDTEKEKWAELLPSRLKELARILEIDRIASCLPQINQLILIPHLFLHLLPLHALPLKDGTYLLDRFDQGIRYAPNCQVLQLTQSKANPQLSHLLAVLNPTEDKDLIYSPIEVQTIQRFFPSADRQVLAGQAATKAALLEQSLESLQYLHFSCHGYFHPQMPLQSGLFLADCYVPESLTAVDPIDHLPLQTGQVINLKKCLTLGDIFNLDLRDCRLVTLSACETGLTEASPGVDEYIGLPSGFLYAGAATVVSSLWTVSDFSTTFLMIRFYENLQNQPSVAVALNSAQRWLRDATGDELQQWMEEKQLSLDPAVKKYVERYFKQHQRPFRSPFHWAAFCAIGG